MPKVHVHFWLVQYDFAVSAVRYITCLATNVATVFILIERKLSHGFMVHY